MFPFGRPEYRTLKWEMPYTRCEVAGLKLRGAAGKDAFSLSSSFFVSPFFVVYVCYVYVCVYMYIWYTYIKVCMHACVFFLFYFFLSFRVFLFSLSPYLFFPSLPMFISLPFFILFPSLFLYSLPQSPYFFKTSPFSCSLSQPWFVYFSISLCSAVYFSGALPILCFYSSFSPSTTSLIFVLKLYLFISHPMSSQYFSSLIKRSP